VLVHAQPAVWFDPAIAERLAEPHLDLLPLFGDAVDVGEVMVERDIAGDHELDTITAIPRMLAFVLIDSDHEPEVTQTSPIAFANGELVARGYVVSLADAQIVCASALPNLDLERLTLPPGARMAGVPHTPGTREYLACEQGTVELAVAGARYTLSAGDVVIFRGDQRHAYANPGKSTAIAYSAIAFASHA